MYTSIRLGSDVVQTFTPFFDSASQTHGTTSNDFCGLRSVELIDHRQWLTLNYDTLTLREDSLGEQGDFVVTLKVGLADWENDVTPIQVTFNVKVDYCKVLEMNLDPGSVHASTVKYTFFIDDFVTIEYANYTQVPNCEWQHDHRLFLNEEE